MPKMIPHYLVHKRMEEHELFRKMKNITGHSLLDEPSNLINLECEAFYIFPLSFEDHPAVKVLSAYVDDFLRSDRNVVYLPTKPAQAYMLGKSHYADPPLDSYIDLVKGEFDKILSSETYKGCQVGDKEALDKLYQHLTTWQQAMREGLESRKLLAAYPYTDENYKLDTAIWNGTGRQ